MTAATALVTPLPRNFDLSPSRSSTASCAPVEAPDGTAARPIDPSSSTTSTSTVGLPRLSRIWRATISTIAVMRGLRTCGLGRERRGLSAESFSWAREALIWLSFRGGRQRRARTHKRRLRRGSDTVEIPSAAVVVMGSGLFAARRPGMTMEAESHERPAPPPRPALDDPRLPRRGAARPRGRTRIRTRTTSPVSPRPSSRRSVR